MGDKLGGPASDVAGLIDREALLHDLELREAMQRVIAGRVPEADIEDVIQEALLAAYNAKRLPADPVRRRKYALGTARKKAAAHRRALRRSPRPKEDANVEEMGRTAPVAPSVAPDAVADRDLLAKIMSDLPESHLLTLEWLARHLMGEELSAIAREAAVDKEVVYKRVATLQRRIVTAAAAFAFVLVFGGLWYALRPRPQIANHRKPAPTAVAPERPATSTQPPQSQDVPAPHPSAPPIVTAHDAAQPYRDEGLDDCKKHEWGDCLWQLDRAKDIDPDGDRDPAIQAARKQAKKALLHMNDKPPLRTPRHPEPDTPPK